LLFTNEKPLSLVESFLEKRVVLKFFYFSTLFKEERSIQGGIVYEY